MIRERHEPIITRAESPGSPELTGSRQPPAEELVWSRKNFVHQSLDTSTLLRLLLRFTLTGHASSSGGVAQLVEQRTHKPRVTRSIRVTATKFLSPRNQTKVPQGHGPIRDGALNPMCGVRQVEEADEGLVDGPCDGEDVGVKSRG